MAYRNARTVCAVQIPFLRQRQHPQTIGVRSFVGAVVQRNFGYDVDFRLSVLMYIINIAFGTLIDFFIACLK